MTEKGNYQSESITNREEVLFEDVKIQWEVGKWIFQHPAMGQIEMDTYSLWNPANWKTIAQRLAQGEMCAMYVAGTYGVGQILESPEWVIDRKIEDSAMLSEIKKRDPRLNLLTFMDPDDQIDVIDVDKLPKAFKDHRWAQVRQNSYAFAEHHVYPLKQNGTVHPSLFRQGDQTIGCFWIRGHFGFQGIVDKLRPMIKHGNFGGGSLNIYKQEPCYTTTQLKELLPKIPDWLKRLRFVIFDEFLETAQIYRSQPIVSFTSEEAKLLREGSLSKRGIREITGIEISEDETKQSASSSTPYDEFHNLIIDERILSSQKQIARYWHFLKEKRVI